MMAMAVVGSGRCCGVGGARAVCGGGSRVEGIQRACACGGCSVDGREDGRNESSGAAGAAEVGEKEWAVSGWDLGCDMK